MNPQAYQELIDRLASRRTAELQAFFASHGLGEAFRAPDEGWGRQHRVNEALAVAEQQGIREDVIADAHRWLGGGLPTGEPAMPPARIRFELQRLAGDLEAWQPWRRTEDAKEYVDRLNECFQHLRASGIDAVPDGAELSAQDLSGTGKTITNEAYGRLQRLVELALDHVPAAGTVGPRADSRLARLHPHVRAVAEQLFLDGHEGSAILEAFKAVNNRVKELAGTQTAGKDGKGLMGHVFGQNTPILALNEGKTVSERDEQEGFSLIFMGAMLGIRNPKAHDLMLPLEEDRTFEYLAFASLLMRRLDDVEARLQATP